jgi:hypothetical protein
MIALIQALMVVVGLLVTLTAQGVSSHKEDERKGYAHDGNKIKASSTFNPSAHDEEIRKANDRALAAATTPSVNGAVVLRTTSSDTASIVGGLVIVGTLIGGLCFFCFRLVSQVRAKVTAQPILTTLSSYELQYQEATLNDLRKGTTPHHYNLSGFLPNKGESVIWAFHGVKHYRLKNHAEWVGRSAGLNVRVAKGIWLHSGASHGHKVQHSSVDSEVGTLVFTTTALCFVGANSVRLPFSHILALNTYSDGIGLHTDYARNSKQIFGDMLCTFENAFRSRQDRY